MKNFFRKFVNKILLPDSRLIYAQAGEDLIMANLFYKLRIDHPTYLDIGANNPAYISNTYYFYLRGSQGVCVEPNPHLAQKFKKLRPRDEVLNVGIGLEDDAEADFYLFPKEADGLGTFSKEDAMYWQEVGMDRVGKIAFEKIIRVKLKTINSMMQYFSPAPDLISLDVEGLDLDILKSMDYERYRPRVFCVETLGYDEHQNEYKHEEITDFLASKGYTVYADTHINTIFINR